MTLAILCAGQGAQHRDMFCRLADEPAAREALETAGRLAGLDLLGGPLALDDEALSENRLAQPLVVGHALAVHAALRARGVAAAVFAGYSVGEIASHACAGAWRPDEALGLVAARAAAMDRACEDGPRQGMTALVGPPVAEAGRLAEAAGVAVAIVNGPDHVVVGGALDALDRFEAAAAPVARHMRRLGVRVASHTPLLAKAAPRFAAALGEAEWRAPEAVVLSGLDGRAVITKDDAVALLSRQIRERIDWARCLESVFEYGATATLEVGPGRSLTRMVEEAYPHAPARAFDDFRSAAGAAAWAARHG